MDPGPDSVRVALAVGLDYIPGSDTKVSFGFDLPPGAEIVRCITTLATEGGQQVGCVERPVADPSGGLVRSTREITATGLMAGEQKGFAIIADLRRTNGLAFDVNRTNAVVRHPYVYDTDIPESCCGPTRPPPGPLMVSTAILFDDVNRIKWAVSPAYGVNTGSGPLEIANSDTYIDTATWEYEITDRHSLPPPYIYGSIEAALAKDTKRVFYAGIAFGTAGAAFTGTLQALLGWLVGRRRP